ncbi:MAG: SurA N-terminal domain-containing protein [Acetobacter fabarum]|jgi:peptidyl-prolyl cis-trans isomerase D|uniref:peptidylprolyl isomerase n=1 Tax=Acetobacter fabarum TaxID=483199 RepID=UPI00242D75AA|nr:SurA N-terminal domain-containing protein [Acetobacter fabarum]MCH4026663.1 SurA N-terminal domain-containing protein [Acetobacter fabarum]MCH4056090.1 SurA N-terminal domain-containing protein [Acetobacter fabarum]MCH4085476.1 SurA N-terminal domain-containing protein [Acetobacter fabarum]MCH4126980.1 SurA N-terminal domain-containing protein [Acetobacter fabarum]MCH4137281.1 SurA N-terminal domain-containing protein [Acetobacter fabarum]
MISYLRRVLVESWLGRVVAIVIFLAFVSWGIGDVIGFMSEETDVVARVGQHRIPTRDLAMALRSEMPTITQQMGVKDPSALSPIMQGQIARQILQRLIAQAELLEAARQLKIIVPDSAIREEVFSLPYFKGPTGQFDRAVFNQRLSAQGLSEQQVLDMIRDDLTVRTLLQPMAQGSRVSNILLKTLVDYGATTRMVDLISIPVAAQPAPPAPDTATLQRYYTNHVWLFGTPELRHARIVVLSPQTVSDTITMDDTQLKRAYDAQSSHYNMQETRDIQLITATSEADAQKIADAWKLKGSWQAAQGAVKGAASVEMPGARPSTIPSDVLKQVLFQAPQGQVTGPVKTEMGWSVFRVTKILPAHSTSFADARQEILQQYRTAAAPSVVTERRRQLQDAIAGKGLDAIPDTIGAAAISGSLDAQGNTAEKQPAPIPASGKLRDAIVHQVFAQKAGDPPNLLEGPDNSWFAVEVDSITPATPRSFEQAKNDVLAAWQADARHHTADQQATALFLAARQKGSIAGQTASGIQVTRDIPFSFTNPGKTLPPEIASYIPRMKAGQAVMAENADTFFVAVVTKVFVPNPPAPIDVLQKLKNNLTQAYGDDLAASYVQDLNKRLPPHINNAAIQAALSAAGFGGPVQ